jgi:hypothetical protein
MTLVTMNTTGLVTTAPIWTPDYSGRVNQLNRVYETESYAKLIT